MAVRPDVSDRFVKLFHTDEFIEDFRYYVTADVWTTVNSATVSLLDAANGGISISPSAGTDNTDGYIRTTQERWLVANDKPLRFKARCQYTEANTDDANVFIGLVNAAATALMVNDGAGPKTTGNYFCFNKVDGGTTWQVRSRNGSETETNDTGITAGGSSYQNFSIFIDNEGAGTNVRVTFAIDGVMCKDATTNLPIVHTIAVASSTEMGIALGLKNGGANLETLNVKAVACAQVRT